MERPEKKEITGLSHSYSLDRGYNQACDDYERFLPSESEIKEIIYSLKNGKGELPPDKNIAKAIHNRIHKG